MAIPSERHNPSTPLDDLPEHRYYSVKDVANLCGITIGRLYSWQRILPTLAIRKRTGSGRRYKKQHIKKIMEFKRLLEVEKLPTREIVYRLSGRRPKIKPPFLHKHRINFETPHRPITKQFIMEVCGVHEKTATKYLQDREAPYMACKLLDIYGRGRVLPENWNHIFINPKSNLEIYQVGEVCENDILNIKWARLLHYSQVETLQKELSDANEKIKQLEQYLSEARQQLGEQPAANE